MVATKWEDITLKKYEELSQFINSKEEMTDLDRSIEIYSILNGDRDKTRDRLLNMSVEQLSLELEKIQFIAEKYQPKVPETEYKINGKKYTVQLNVRQMTAAQYIDFQNFYKEYDKNFKYIFLCFLIPKGHNYADGYDVIELAEELYDVISIATVMDIMVFFCKLFQSLTQATLNYSIKEMKKMMKTEKDPKKIKEMRRVIMKTMEALNSVKSEAGLFE